MEMGTKDTVEHCIADEPFQTAIDHIAYSVRNLDKFPDQRSRDRFVERAPEAMRIAAYATEVLDRCSCAIDEAIATGQLEASEDYRLPRTQQESLLAGWALAHAHAYEGDGLIESFDLVISSRLGLLQLGLDPAILLPPK